jgi:hypothetical protein
MISCIPGFGESFEYVERFEPREKQAVDNSNSPATFIVGEAELMNDVLTHIRTSDVCRSA